MGKSGEKLFIEVEFEEMSAREVELLEMLDEAAAEGDLDAIIGIFVALHEEVSE